MDAQKIHLLLNHYPMIGTLIGIPLLVIGLWWKNDKVKRISLWIFVGVALLALPIYATGEIAGKELAGGMFGDLVKQHKGSALIAFGLSEATGAASLIGLILLYRNPQKARWVVLLALVLSLASAVVVTQTTLMGRQIKFGPVDNGAQPQAVLQNKEHIKQEKGEKIWLA